MKPARVLILGFALSLGLSLTSFAEQVQGFVESVDSSNQTILIKDPVSGAEKAVRVHPKALTDVKKGSVVKASFKTDSDQADTLDVLIPR